MIYLLIDENNVNSYISIAQVTDKLTCAQVLAVYQSERWE